MMMRPLAPHRADDPPQQALLHSVADAGAAKAAMVLSQ
jgi:hypothetical protein